MTTYTNPVYPEYFADPFVWKHEGIYYAVGTAPGAVGGGAFPLLRSRDLVRWTAIGHALAAPDPRHGNTCWAPEVAFEGGRFYLYYSIGFDDKRHQIRVAVSDRPEGPYVDTPDALVDTCSTAFAIDPHPFRDEDGKWYLFYAQDFLDSENGARVGTALVVQPMESMTRLTGPWMVVQRARFDWQRFEKGRTMYGGVHDWHTLEGPAVLKRGDRYYCFYSGGRWENESYGVDYAVAKQVLGPYVSEPTAAPRVLRTVPGRVVGPGHNSFVKGPDGETDYIVYHAWDPAMTVRRICVDELRWTDEGPRCEATWRPHTL